MKTLQTKTKAFLCALVLIAVTGCAAETPTTPASEDSALKQQLQGRSFTLASIDGQKFKSKERAPTIEFSDTFRVTGAVCNRFMGDGMLEGDTLFVKQMATTQMMCADPALNTLEHAFAVMMQEGATVALQEKGPTLILKGKTHTLAYTPTRKKGKF